jgi:hypothetical protein
MDFPGRGEGVGHVAVATRAQGDNRFPQEASFSGRVRVVAGRAGPGGRRAVLVGPFRDLGIVAGEAELLLVGLDQKL